MCSNVNYLVCNFSSDKLIANVLTDLISGTHWKQLLNLPGANPAAAGLPMDG